jgi:CDP-diacylglycerol---glycerol-3-phosphate 3-phosphatidyltransferase
MTFRTSRIACEYFRIMEKTLLPELNQRFSPNQLTLMGAALSVFVPVGFYFHPGVGLFFMALSGMADSMDGLLAKLQGKTSRFGAFLDSSLDRVSDVFYLTGFWVLFWPLPGFRLASSLVMGALLATLLISYTRARCEGLGGKCDRGLMERGLRTVYLYAWALLIIAFPGRNGVVLWAGLTLYTLLTAFTAAQRILHIKSRLTE